MKEIKGTLIFATVAEDASCIQLRIATDDNDLRIVSLGVNEELGDINVKLKEGMDARKELQKVCDLLNGYIEGENGSLIPRPGFLPRRITIQAK